MVLDLQLLRQEVKKNKAKYKMDHVAFKELVSLIQSLAVLKPEDKGYNPLYHIPCHSRFPKGNKEPLAGTTVTFVATGAFAEEQFFIKQILFRRQSLRSRGTWVFLVENGNGEQYILKDVWQEQHRTPEWEFYAKVEGKPHVPIPYHHQVVTISGHEDTTDFCRGNPDIGIGIRDKNNEPLSGVQHRVHDQILFKPSGTPLSLFEQPTDTLNAIHGALKGTHVFIL